MVSIASLCMFHKRFCGCVCVQVLLLGTTFVSRRKILFHDLSVLSSSFVCQMGRCWNVSVLVWILLRLSSTSPTPTAISTLVNLIISITFGPLLEDPCRKRTSSGWLKIRNNTCATSLSTSLPTHSVHSESQITHTSSCTILHLMIFALSYHRI
jgi:hypothetical protein